MFKQKLKLITAKIFLLDVKRSTVFYNFTIQGYKLFNTEQAKAVWSTISIPKYTGCKISLSTVLA